MKNKRFKALNKLMHFINNKIDAGLSNKTLIFHVNSDLKYPVKSLDINARSIEYGSPIPFYSCLGLTSDSQEQLIKLIEKSSEFKNAITYLKNDPEQCSALLNSIITRITKLKYSKHNLNNEDLSYLTTVLINELKGKPIKHSAIIELEGLTLSNEIVIKNGVKLRKIEPNDLVKEVFPVEPHFIMPTAILEIEHLCKNFNELRNYVTKVIILLKLYKVGSIHDVKLTLSSDSVTPMLEAGPIHTKTLAIMENFSLNSRDETNLVNFCENFFDIIPNEFILFRSDNGHLRIAFDRYNNCLFNNNIVKRITYAAMGLEALYTESGGEGELSFKFKKRIAKTLGMFGFNTVRVNNVLERVYKIRSNFVHGNNSNINDNISGFEQSLKAKNLIDKNDTFNDFVKNIMEILRISILLFLIVEEKSKCNKKTFIKLIDCSLIDQDSEKKLFKLIKGLPISLDYNFLMGFD